MMLEGLGLDRQTEGVYRLMLTNHRWGVAELAGRLGMTDAELRDCLDRLAELRLLTPSAVPGELRPVHPKAGLQALLQGQEAELQLRQTELDQAREAVACLIDEFSDLYSGNRQRHAEQLIGMAAITARIESLAREAVSECLTFNPGGAQSQASLDASKPLDRDVIGRGVAMRTVYLDSVRNDTVTTEYAGWLTGLGAEVRTAPTLPLRMLLIDREVALVPVDPDNTRKGAVQLTGNGVVAGLVALFERVWESAVPLGAGPERDEQGLTRQQQELLRLLGEGLTDAAAGNRLGLSLRTVRRMMADLMEQLDAQSRFVAGLRAGRRGWL
ncbi:LuxR C-terminal-related transcriptional regulator [Streptomyces sp. NPDC048357]|uniref:TrmB family transcriptional regulator n=1 Tax=Streptomyces sp. NPDC048357 TaxID=3154719 RepID=UPI00341410E2